MKNKILYLPLDERPCNWLLPQNIVAGCVSTELITPPVQLLGKKKHPADTQKLWDFVNHHIKDCDCAVMSAEMLFFGGLLPSRLHHDPESSIQEKIGRLRSLKQAHPEIPIYLFELIMRTPRYNSSDEEPDYYETYGARIFKRTYLKDKLSRCHLSPEEQNLLDTLEHQIPVEYIQDYEQRRKLNRSVLEAVLHLVQDGTVELLYIPQDDSCEFGYTAIDQSYILQAITRLKIQDRVYLHPGADEAGAELLSRAYLNLSRNTPRVYVTYSSTLGAQIIPLYEDRILEASIQQHILASGCVQCDTPDDADFILAVNTPGKIMQESSEQQNSDITYQSFRCLRAYVQQLALYIDQGKRVAVADCAYANGGEIAFIQELDRIGILDRLVSYKGWNTACNTIGTSLAQAIFALDNPNPKQIRRNLAYHLLDDAFYQGLVRGQLQVVVESDGLSYFDLKNNPETYAHMCKTLLKQTWSKVIRTGFSDTDMDAFQVYFPWNRLFEIGILWTNNSNGLIGGMPSNTENE